MKWADGDAAVEVRGELERLGRRRFPRDGEAAGKWLAQCLRRDVRALRDVRPSFGMGPLPLALAAHREVDAALSSLLHVVDDRAGVVRWACA